MNPIIYVQAVYDAIQSGMSPDTALTGLDHALLKRKHQKLKKSILHMLVRRFERNAEGFVELSVAHADDVKKHAVAIKKVAEQVSVAVPVDVTIDETLIGGFVITTQTVRIDQSYKRTLVKLYRGITQQQLTQPSIT